MAQFSNDCKGIQYVSNDAGQIVFLRPQATSQNMLVTGSIAVAGWQLTDGVENLATGANSINTSNGALSSGSSFN